MALFPLPELHSRHKRGHFQKSTKLCPTGLRAHHDADRTQATGTGACGPALSRLDNVRAASPPNVSPAWQALFTPSPSSSEPQHQRGTHWSSSFSMPKNHLQSGLAHANSLAWGRAQESALLPGFLSPSPTHPRESVDQINAA